MNILQRIKKFGLLKGLVVNPTLTRQFYASPNQLAGTQSITDPYSQNPWVFAAINATAQAASSVPFQIMQASEPSAEGSGRRSRFRSDLERARKRQLNKAAYSEEDNGEPVSSGEFYDLFRNPNPDLSAMQVWETTSAFYKLRGEAAWILESSGDARLREDEIPSEIWPVEPRLLKETLDKKTGRITQWTLTGVNPATGEQVNIPYDPHEVIMFHTFNPKSRHRGMDQLTAAMMGLDQDYKASVYNQSFFDNRAEPGGILSTDTELADEQARTVRRLWEDRHAGSGKAFRIAILHNGMKYQEVKPFSHSDMQFLDQKKWNREEVLAVLKVPKMIVGIYEDINYATSQTAAKLFWEGAVIPMLRNFEDTLMNRLFVPLTSENEWGMFDLSCVEALQENLLDKSVIADRFVRMGYPLNVVNSRLEMGFPETEAGDIEYAPSGLTPALMVDPSMFETEAEQEDNGNGSAPPSDTAPGTPPPPAETSESASSPSTTITRRATQARNRLERVYNPGETIMLGKIKRYIYSLRTETLKRLSAVTSHRKAESPPLLPEDIEAILFAEEEWNRKLQEMMKPAYKKTMEMSWNQTAKDIGSSLAFDLQDPRILSLMGRKLASLVRVNASLRKRIRSVLINALADSLTVDETATELKSTFNQMSAGQALTIARTETGFASVGAQAELYRAEKIEWVTWGTAEDELVRDSHVRAGNDQPIRFMLEKFSNGLHYPLEMGAPAEEVINCRCSLDAYFPE